MHNLGGRAFESGATDALLLASPTYTLILPARWPARAGALGGCVPEILPGWLADG